MEESPRWLLNKGKVEETKKFVLKAANINNVKISKDDVEDLKPDLAAPGGKIWHLFTYRVLRYKTLVIFFNW